jgi:hypothetical protein
MRSVLALVMSVMLPAAAFADPSPPSPTDGPHPRSAECERDRPARTGSPAGSPAHWQREACLLKFDPEDVAGKAPTLDDVGVRIITFGTAASLVSVRRHFIPEILKTAEDL